MVNTPYDGWSATGHGPLRSIVYYFLLTAIYGTTADEFINWDDLSHILSTLEEALGYRPIAGQEGLLYRSDRTSVVHDEMSLTPTDAISAVLFVFSPSPSPVINTCDIPCLVA